MPTNDPTCCTVPARAPRAPGDARRQRGLTLVEVMITLTIAAILASLGVPGFVDLIRTKNLAAAASDLKSDLNFARSEAVKRNRRVLVCPAGASANTCGSGTDWAAGWLVCVDADANGACDTPTTSAPNPLRVKAAAQAINVAGPSGAMRFSGGGEAPVTYSFSVSGTWSGTAVKTVAVETSGMIRN